MDELVNLLIEKTGVSEDKAREVVDVVIEFFEVQASRALPWSS